MKQVVRNPLKRRSRLTIARAAFTKINAIEGLDLTVEMNQVFDEFEREKLLPAERPRVIPAKYGKILAMLHAAKPLDGGGLR